MRTDKTLFRWPWRQGSPNRSDRGGKPVFETKPIAAFSPKQLARNFLSAFFQSVFIRVHPCFDAKKNKILPGSIALAALLCLSSPVGAQTPVLRHVLVLYDSDSGQSAMENVIFQGGQMVLNHLGMLTDYWDVNRRPLPDDKAMAPYRGVMSTFVSAVGQDPEGYLQWLLHQGRQGRKILIMGNPGLAEAYPASPQAQRLRQDLFAHLGLSYRGDFTGSAALISLVHQDRQNVGFERAYPVFLPSYAGIAPASTALKVHLQAQRSDRPDSVGVFVATGSAGGYAREGYVFWEDPVTFKRQWYIDPFAFFEQALGLDGLPRLDPTTLNGMRVAFSHIDADGFGGLSRIDGKTRCAAMIRDEVLKKYDYPVTVSVITGEIDPAARGSAEMVELARSIFALPNVEPASHSYTHPFYWDPDDSYAQAVYESGQYGIDIPGYRFDPKAEIDDSMAYISRHLSPPDKPCKVFLWTGNCRPLAEHIARCDDLGASNMNGGDTVYDDMNASYMAVAPYYRKVGEHYQIHTGQANENILTNLWQGPFFGFRQIIATMANTERPRRVAPIDIYYHFYSGEYKSSLRAVQDVYEWALGQDLAKVFTSDYIGMVNDFIRATVFEDGTGRFVVRNYGRCLTIRLDNLSLKPDLAQCRNVIGYVADPQGLYISLAPGQNEAVIRMGDRPGPVPPHVQRAAGWVEGFFRQQRRLDFSFKGFGKGPIELAGLPPAASVKVFHPHGKVDDVRTDAEGKLIISPAQNGAYRIQWP